MLSNSTASETEKVQRLFDGLPAALKSAFVCVRRLRCKLSSSG